MKLKDLSPGQTIYVYFKSLGAFGKYSYIGGNSFYDERHIERYLDNSDISDAFLTKDECMIFVIKHQIETKAEEISQVRNKLKKLEASLEQFKSHNKDLMDKYPEEFL